MSTLEAYGFRKLSVEDKDLFAGYFSRMNDNWASSICFASMITWNSSINIYHKIIGDYICCLAHDTTCPRWVLLPYIGYYDMEAVEACTEEVLKIMSDLKLPVIFTDVSKWMLPFYQNLKRVQLKESYDLGLSDYIYTAEDFLKGLDRQYSRYDYNYFIKKNDPKLEEMHNENITQYLEFIKKHWCSTHACDYCQYGCLIDSATNLIGVAESAGAKGITVYVDNIMVGYIIVTMERNQLVFHLKKGIHGIRGLSEYMHRNCYELFGQEAETVNYTEDMNFEGLRRYKQRLALKYEMVHKYELS